MKCLKILKNCLIFLCIAAVTAVMCVLMAFTVGKIGVGASIIYSICFFSIAFLSALSAVLLEIKEAHEVMHEVMNDE